MLFFLCDLCDLCGEISSLWFNTEMDVTIEHLTDLPRAVLVGLVVESEAAGLRFVRRLSDEWTANTNRFDQPGEALFGAWAAAHLVGVCGLNVDPYTEDGKVGRVRHLYVLTPFRRLGIGRQLVQTLVAAAQGRFRSLRLRTENREAAVFYERLGFRPQFGAPDCTHILDLAVY
jgi:GNAT superfamily N-acetyltransferase